MSVPGLGGGGHHHKLGIAGVGGRLATPIIGSGASLAELGYGDPTLEYHEAGLYSFAFNVAAGETPALSLSTDTSPGPPTQATTVEWEVVDPSTTTTVSSSGGPVPISPTTPVLVTAPMASAATTLLVNVTSDGHHELSKSSGADIGLYAVDCPTVSEPPPVVPISSITLSPNGVVNEVGTSHIVTATVLTTGGIPIPNLPVTFTVTAGPHVTTTGSDTTNASGDATFAYTGTTIGIDTIVAEAIDPVTGSPVLSNPVTKEWMRAPPSGDVVVTCQETHNPSGRKVPTAGKNPKSGQNPDGFYVLSVSGADEVFLADSGSTFVAGPFPDGTKIELKQAPGATPNVKPGRGDIDWKIKLNGDGVATAFDGAGNPTTVSCRVPPPPK